MKQSLFTLCLLLSLAAAHAQEQRVVRDGIEYRYVLTSATATVVGYDAAEVDWDEIDIPESINASGTRCTVVAVGDRAFRGCSDLGYIILPKCVASIGEEAFSGCTSLSSIEMDGVQTVGKKAFRGCGFEWIEMPALTHLGDNAFENNEALAHVECGEGVIHVGNHVFDGCPNDMDISFAGTVAPNFMPYAFTEEYGGEGSMLVPAGRAQHYYGRFVHCPNGDPAVIPVERTKTLNSYIGRIEEYRNGMHALERRTIRRLNVKGSLSLGDWVNARAMCTKADGYWGCNVQCIDLTDATFKVKGTQTSWGEMKMEKDAKIPDYAFKGCTNLDTIFLPKSATYEVGDMMYFGGRDIFAGTPSRLVVVAPYEYTRLGYLRPGFSHSDADNQRTLLVPKGYLDVYKQAEGWKEFAVIREYDPDYYTSDINTDGSVDVADVTVLVSKILGK